MQLHIASFNGSRANLDQFILYPERLPKSLRKFSVNGAPLHGVRVCPQLMITHPHPPLRCVRSWAHSLSLMTSCSDLLVPIGGREGERESGWNGDGGEGVLLTGGL